VLIRDGGPPLPKLAKLPILVRLSSLRLLRRLVREPSAGEEYTVFLAPNSVSTLKPGLLLGKFMSGGSEVGRSSLGRSMGKLSERGDLD